MPTGALLPPPAWSSWPGMQLCQRWRCWHGCGLPRFSGRLAPRLAGDGSGALHGVKPQEHTRRGCMAGGRCAVVVTVEQGRYQRLRASCCLAFRIALEPRGDL
jgi:hypothetical protein